MKNTILLFSFFLMISGIQAQQKNNGWEFLEWKTDSVEVQKQLEKNKKLLKEPHALDADFNYQDMNTWLQYDAEKKLYKVVQRCTFSVNENKKARAAYEQIRVRLMKTYGLITTEKKDSVKEVITLDWDLKYTRIHLEYDYQYKVIDELGAGSYWIDVLFEAK